MGAVAELLIQAIKSSKTSFLSYTFHIHFNIRASRSTAYYFQTQLHSLLLSVTQRPDKPLQATPLPQAPLSEYSNIEKREPNSKYWLPIPSTHIEITLGQKTKWSLRKPANLWTSLRARVGCVAAVSPTPCRAFHSFCNNESPGTVVNDFVTGDGNQECELEYCLHVHGKWRFLGGPCTCQIYYPGDSLPPNANKPPASFPPMPAHQPMPEGWDD